MRKLLMTSTMFLFAALPARAQDDASRTIVDNALKAMGGADKVSAIKSMTAKAKGTVNFMDLDIGFTLDLYAQPPTKSKAIINITLMDQRIEIVKAFVGDKGWESTNGEVKDLTDDDIKQHKDERYIEDITGLFALKTDKALKLSPLGEIKVGDAPCVGVQVSKQGKRDVNLYFDKKTSLLVKAEWRAPHPFTKEEVAQEKFYSDYKELVPGLKTASKQTIHVEGMKFMELELTDIQPVEHHDDSIFARPK
jgi:hypothetical protein